MASTKGLREWIVQRVSAVYMAIYIILFFAYLAFHPHFYYQVWEGFFHVIWVQIPTLIFLLLLLWHAWIGVWTVITDYIKIPALRMLVQLLVILALLVYFFWGLQIIWHIPLYWTFV